MINWSFLFSDVPPTVAETKMNFLRSYKRPIPSIYNTVLQELLVQQHLLRYKRTYQYDAIFALGFVTVYEQLMEGYPSSEDQDAIFRAYIEALNEDPEKYRSPPPLSLRARMCVKTCVHLIQDLVNIAYVVVYVPTCVSYT